MKKGVRGFTGPTDDEARLKRDKLVDEMKSLTAEIEKLRKLQQDARQGATIQQQSFDGSGPFAGLIPKRVDRWDGGIRERRARAGLAMGRHWRPVPGAALAVGGHAGHAPSIDRRRHGF